MTEKILITKCPTCGKSITYDKNNPQRPFCSKPCYDQDLTAWANETFFIKGKEMDASEEGEDISSQVEAEE